MVGRVVSIETFNVVVHTLERYLELSGSVLVFLFVYFFFWKYYYWTFQVPFP